MQRSVTIRQVLAEADALRKVSSTWRLDAELLLAEALAQPREYLHTWPERTIDPAALQQFYLMFARRTLGEPLAYILGRKDFWDFQLHVNADVLIPRPETELLVECVLELVQYRRCNARQLADLGTGSGAIAIALARELPDCAVMAVDRSDAALVLAQDNANRLGVHNIEFREGFWCEGLAANSFDLVVANPPYVAAGDAHLQEGDLRFEPEMALVAADDGLGDIKSIVQQSGEILRRDGWLLIEHGYNQRAEVQRIFADNTFTDIACRQDLAGQDRVTLGRRPG